MIKKPICPVFLNHWKCQIHTCICNSDDKSHGVMKIWMKLYIVGCRGVTQLGGPDQCQNQGGPAKVEARKSFLFT